MKLELPKRLSFNNYTCKIEQKNSKLTIHKKGRLLFDYPNYFTYILNHVAKESNSKASWKFIPRDISIEDLKKVNSLINVSKTKFYI